ncbi:rRNA methyltransferase [Pleurocapsa sp. CCALA 161]|uniref:TrmH family RNA methyltransferase n=1 Tax=Pleurocapsa sp. CCALA 161 TaxID=2107688 RepID=UPI000D04CEC0|nr:rRNA methyltransferase [Pleurocapsa sp. CCALA 161]
MLTSIQNPLVKQVRKLHRAQERQKQNLLLIEGTNLVEAACQADYKLDIIFHTERWQQNHQPLCRIIAEQGIRAELVSPEVLNSIATTVNPDGVVAIAPRPISEPVPTLKNVGIALERLQDPGNLGTIIRTAVAAGVDGLWLSPDSVDFYSPKVLRASVGQWFRLPVMTNQDLSQLIEQQQGVQIIATTSQATKTYWEVDFTRPSLILLGNEGAGLSSQLLDLADIHIKIPLANHVESLNVAIATALLLYEAQRQLTMNNNQ